MLVLIGIFLRLILSINYVYKSSLSFLIVNKHLPIILANKLLTYITSSVSNLTYNPSDIKSINS